MTSDLLDPTGANARELRSQQNKTKQTAPPPPPKKRLEDVETLRSVHQNLPSASFQVLRDDDGP